MPLSSLVDDNLSRETNISETIVKVPDMEKHVNSRDSRVPSTATINSKVPMMGCYGRSSPGKGKNVCGLYCASSLSSSHKELNIFQCGDRHNLFTLSLMLTLPVLSH